MRPGRRDSLPGRLCWTRPTAHPTCCLPEMKEDFGKFLQTFAEQYFKVVHDALAKHDPHHLYLGCRFAWRTQEAVNAAARYCDVVSFNIYRSHLEPEDWAFTTSLNKPCIIGEFHFGAVDRGMFHTGLVATASQQARAAMYKQYIESVEDNPAFVGCHWFQYYDEPLTGRVYDGKTTISGSFPSRTRLTPKWSKARRRSTRRFISGGIRLYFQESQHGRS